MVKRLTHYRRQADSGIGPLAGVKSEPLFMFQYCATGMRHIDEVNPNM